MSEYGELKRLVALAVVEDDLQSTYRDLVNFQDALVDLYEDIEKLRAALGVARG